MAKLNRKAAFSAFGSIKRIKFEILVYVTFLMLIITIEWDGWLSEFCCRGKIKQRREKIYKQTRTHTIKMEGKWTESAREMDANIQSYKENSSCSPKQSLVFFHFTRSFSISITLGCMLICLLDHAVNPCRRNILFHYHLLTANFIIMVILTIFESNPNCGQIT